MKSIDMFLGKLFLAFSIIMTLIFLSLLPADGIMRASAEGNLIPNPSVETASSVPSVPLDWATDKWGTNTSTFTYPVAGHEGAKGMRVEVKAYTKGDAKWYFKHIPITPGKTYVFSDHYQSNIQSNVTLEFKTTSNTYSYLSLGDIAAAPSWTRYSKSFVAPANATAVTVLHLLKKVGYLETDDFSLSLSGSSGTGTSDTQSPSVSVTSPKVNATLSGTVSISAEASDDTGVAGVQFLLDGASLGNEIVTAPYTYSWNTSSGVSNGPHGISAKARDAAGNSFVSVMIPVTVSNEVIIPDTTAPVISIVSPSDNSIVKGKVPITLSGTDDVGITRVRFQLDGANIGNELNAPPYAYELDTLSGITNGMHKIGAVAFDAAGNSASSPQITVNVSNPVADTALPTINWIEPPVNSTLSGAVLLSADAADNVGVVRVIFYIDGQSYGSGTVGTGSASIYSLLVDTAALSNGMHQVHAEAYDLADNIGKTVAIQVKVDNPIPDAIVPVVSITSPSNGAILSGTSTISISATDNNTVEFVHYTVSNGKDVIIGQIMAAPYIIQLSPDSLMNGSHVITVYAQDKAGNIGNAQPVTFNTYYTPPPPLNPNLIRNPSLEAGSGGLPDNWYQGIWGTNSAIFSYPVIGIDGLYAADINMSSYTDGDAKWYFEDVPVTPGQSYIFSDQYVSTTTSTLTARYTTTTGSLIYVDIVSNLPASPTWVKAAQSLTVPADVATMTVFHLVNSTGALTVDDMSLRLASTGSTGGVDPNGFTTGMVSLTFDDGWSSQYDNALPILDSVGIKGSFFIISNEMKNAINANRISNPSFEVVTEGNEPSDWIGSKTGLNDAVFTYPVTGVSGGKAGKVEITSYTSGDAKWRFAETTLANNELYNFTDQYISTVTTVVTAEYTLNDGTKQIVNLGTVKASPTWAIASFTFRPPVDTKSLTVYHRLMSIGTLTTDDYHLDLAQGYMNTSEVQEMYRSGQEVSAHTRTHPFLTQLTAEKALDEISGSRQDLLAAGISPSDTFVYPYGDYNASIIQASKDAGYIGARSVDEGYNNKLTDRYALMIQQVNKTTTPEQWESWTQTAMANHTWLILMFHQIDNQNDQYGAKPDDLKTYVDYLATNGIPVVTMKQGLEMMSQQQ